MATCKYEEIPYIYGYCEKSLSIVLLLFCRHLLTEHNFY